MAEPFYKQIYNDLKQAILNAEYQIGEQLPTDTELTKKYNVSSITIKKAMDMLKDDDLITRKPRIGTIVSNNQLSQIPSNVTNGLPLIGLIITNFDDVFGTDVVRSMLIESNSKVQIICKMSNGDPDLESKLIEEMVQLGVNGILLLPTSTEYISPKVLELVSRDFPIVFIDRKMGKLPSCSVQTDNNSAAQFLTEHLFGQGHQRIGIITSSSDVSTIEDRVDGFIGAHVKHHIPINQSQIFQGLKSVIPNSNVSLEEDVKLIKEFLKREQELTAIFTAEYNIALLVQKAMAELGKQIYQDYSLVCFDHPKVNPMDLNSFTFTHIYQDQNVMGAEALNLLLQKIKQPNLIEKIDIPYQLIEGQSVNSIK